MAIRGIDAALDMARSTSVTGTRVYNQKCLQFCRMMYGIPLKYPDAATAWTKSASKHEGKGWPPPRGSLLYWTGGSAGHGHVAISDGAGGIWSNWYPSEGRIRHMTFDDVRKSMPNLHYAGWSWVLNDIDVRTSKVVAGNLTDKPAPDVHDWVISDGFPGAGAFVLGQEHPAVTLLGRQLKALGFAKNFAGKSYTPSPKFTTYDKANVREFQMAQGWRGTNADGYPGPVTWEKLFAEAKGD